MSENRYLKEEPKEEELFDEVRKLFNLKRTEFIVDWLYTLGLTN